jgi:uncharacterized protein
MQIRCISTDQQVGKGFLSMVIKMRRSDRELSLSEAREILKNGEYGILSTTSTDGQPYGVPLNYCYLRDSIYFHCALEGHKLENIRENNRVSFCVVGNTELLPETFSSKYESAIVFGNISELQAMKSYLD